ncbi:SMI1/KNR4 family protein [Streptomyces cucumeris]|uniref:SMI1/KNR4 family protein n=1 Tax=Streptomyces cucumeris TaxID=2962890 RepID=UPI003D72D083
MPPTDGERVHVFRTERRRDGAETWEPGPRLRVAVDAGEPSPLAPGLGLGPGFELEPALELERLGWRTCDGAEAAIGFRAAMDGFHGYYRCAGGASAEYRGTRERCETAGESTAHRFRTEESHGTGWHTAGDLSLLLEDGDAHVVHLDWHGEAIGSGAVALRTAATAPDPGSEVSGLVGAVRAHDEYEAAGEVAKNLMDCSAGKWLGDGTGSAWLEFDCVRPVVVRHYALVSANDCPDRDPVDWTLQGSSDGRHWAVLDSRSGQVFTRRHQSRGFTVSAGTGVAYRHYRLEISANAGSDSVQLRQVRFFETAPVAAYEGFFGYRQQTGGEPTGFRGTVRTPAREEPGPRTVEEWRDYLADYGADILRLSEEGELSEVSEAQRAAGWLGFDGADEARLTALEERLGTRLPPSYRSFLGASDGWLYLSDFMWEMRTTATVDWLTEADLALADAFMLGDDPGQDAVFQRSLLISQEGDAQYWLLDPGDVSEDGEWAAYIWASWYPGLGERHGSFAELVRAERAGFEQLRGHEGRGVDPRKAGELLARGREQALRGEAEQALATFERAADKGSSTGLYLMTILGAFLDPRSVHHEIRANVLGRDRVIAAVGEERVRAEAVPLYLRRTVEDHRPDGGLPRPEALGRLVPGLAFQAELSDDAWIARAAAHEPPRLPEAPAFEQALDLARTLAAQGDDEGAWTVVVAALRHWHSDDPDRIAPVVLLTDPVLRDVITPHRARLVVTLPRGR